MTPLPLEFYRQSDVVALAKQLLGKWLFSNIGGKLVGGMITETEAYKGAEDKACHAYNQRKTNRTAVMFEPGGVAYVYLCYGMHHLLNVVTNEENTPHAILIRALKPDIGIDTIVQRRKERKNLTSGPGTLCAALGITREHNGHHLNEHPLWIEDRGLSPKPCEIRATARIGIDYAEEDAHLPWRFLLENQ